MVSWMVYQISTARKIQFSAVVAIYGYAVAAIYGNLSLADGRHAI